MSEFHPNWVSPPGDTIAELLEERGVSRAEFAKRIGTSTQFTEDLLEGKVTITIATAQKLNEVLGGSPDFWMARDFQFWQDFQQTGHDDAQWLKQLPISDMVRFGWVARPARPSDELNTQLKFFDVPDLASWRKKYGRIEELVAFRTTSSFESRPASVATWIRRGEIEASRIKCAPWDPVAFSRSLDSIRTLTKEKNPARFLPTLRDICSACGVAVASVRAPSGCRASGATMFLSEDKALLLLSFRYLSDDQLWFSFFHEAGHLILHGQGDLFVEGLDRTKSTQEAEANDFAEDILVPLEYRSEMFSLPLDDKAIIRFAKKIGISPGIVVGQLQHYSKIRRNHFNGLKRRYEWQEG